MSAETQAARITRICGIKNISRWTGVSETSVYRWDHSKEKGGSGGKIPSEHHQAILNGARAEGYTLGPDDFFDPEKGELPTPSTHASKPSSASSSRSSSASRTSISEKGAA